MQFETQSKEKPSMCAICENNIRSIYPVEVICISFTVTTMQYFICYYTFKLNSEQYSDAMISEYITKATFPMTCTVCDSDINVNVEVNKDAAYMCNYSYKHKPLSCYLIIDYNTTNIIIIGKISETHSVNSEITKEKPFQCIICGHNNNNVYSFSITIINTILYLCYCTQNCNHNQYKACSKVPYMISYSISVYIPNLNNPPRLFYKYKNSLPQYLYDSYISKQLSATECDFNYTVLVTYVNEQENIYVTIIHYKLHAIRRGR